MVPKKTFRQILAECAASNGASLDARSRLANWLAKAYPEEARAFYQIKHRALAQLLANDCFQPTIDAVESHRGSLILSIRLRTWGRLHIPVSAIPTAILFRINGQIAAVLSHSGSVRRPSIKVVPTSAQRRMSHGR